MAKNSRRRVDPQIRAYFARQVEAVRISAPPAKSVVNPLVDPVTVPSKRAQPAVRSVKMGDLATAAAAALILVLGITYIGSDRTPRLARAAAEAIELYDVESRVSAALAEASRVFRLGRNIEPIANGGNE